jgi:hypothetical protein
MPIREPSLMEKLQQRVQQYTALIARFGNCVMDVVVYRAQ